MRFVVLGFVCLLAACAARTPAYVQACEEYGLVPGTPQYQKCVDAKTRQQLSGARSAIDTVRSVDVTGSFK
jgi:hypothetical protein